MAVAKLRETQQPVNPHVGFGFPFRFTTTGRVATVGGDPNVEFPPAQTVDQAIQAGVKQILMTGKQERVMLPQFGVGAERFIFQPLQRYLMGLLSDDVEEQVNWWSERSLVLASAAQMEPADGELSVFVQLRHLETSDESVVKVAVGPGVTTV